MNLTVCKKICNECPFSNTSIPGWLGPHTVDKILDTQQYEYPFLCHLHLKDESPYITHHKLEAGEIPICRGFILSATKSCKLFGQNTTYGAELLRLQQEVKLDDDNLDNILSRVEFKKYHEKNG